MFLLIDPAVVTPDIVPLTGIVWVDATVNILVAISGLVAIVSSLIARFGPKNSPVTQWVAQNMPAADTKGIVAEAAAKKEAAAQAVGETTVKPPPSPPAPPPPPISDGAL